MTVILETFGMMVFTFIVGMGVAYLIELLTISFHFFRKENLSVVISDYKRNIALEHKRHAAIRKRIEKVEEHSDIDRIRYIYENKSKYDAEEEVDDTYNLFKFYKGIYKDKKENEGFDSLIKYYYDNDGDDGEV